MPEYRFFFWDESADRISHVEVRECADDAAATAWVEHTFGDKADYKVAEIWSGDVLMARHHRAR